MWGPLSPAHWRDERSDGLIIQDRIADGAAYGLAGRHAQEPNFPRPEFRTVKERTDGVKKWGYQEYASTFF